MTPLAYLLLGILIGIVLCVVFIFTFTREATKADENTWRDDV